MLRREENENTSRAEAVTYVGQRTNLLLLEGALAIFQSGILIDSESKANLVKINELLKIHPAIFIANHTTMRDALSILLKLQLKNLKKAAIPLAEKYAIPNSSEKLSYLTSSLSQLGSLVGITFIPVPQGKHALGGSELISHYYQHVEKLLSQPGHVLALTPGGERQDTLGEIKTGVINAAARAREGFIVPFGLQLVGTMRLLVTVGEPVMIEEIIGDVLDHYAELEAKRQALDYLEMERVIKSYVAYLLSVTSETETTNATIALEIVKLQAELQELNSQDMEITRQIKSVLRMGADRLGELIADQLPQAMNEHYGQKQL